MGSRVPRARHVSIYPHSTHALYLVRTRTCAVMRWHGSDFLDGPGGCVEFSWSVSKLLHQSSRLDQLVFRKSTLGALVGSEQSAYVAKHWMTSAGGYRPGPRSAFRAWL